MDGGHEKSMLGYNYRGNDFHPHKFSYNQGLLSDNDNKALLNLHIDFDENRGAFYEKDDEDDSDKVNKHFKVLREYILKS